MFHLWTYSKTVKVSEAYWITTLTVISWYVTGNVIKKGQINTAFLKRDIVMPTLTFNLHLWTTFGNQKWNFDQQTVLTASYSEL